MRYIVIFDKKAYQISGKLYTDIVEYIDDNYVDEHSDNYSVRLRRLNALRDLEPVCEASVCEEADEASEPRSDQDECRYATPHRR